jgi:predicted ArsR family transcriptional regulator
MFAWSEHLERQLNRIEQKLDRLFILFQQETEKMAVDLTALTAEVANNTAVDSSIEQLVQNIAAQLAALAAGTGDAATQTALNALVATLQNNDTAIAAAVTANTPAAPAAKPAS